MPTTVAAETHSPEVVAQAHAAMQQHMPDDHDPQLCRADTHGETGYQDEGRAAFPCRTRRQARKILVDAGRLVSREPRHRATS